MIPSSGIDTLGLQLMSYHAPRANETVDVRSQSGSCGGENCER